jgi:hypothetical protein
MATRWQSRETDVTLPTATVREMWERARRYFDVSDGARFDARSATTMLLWSSRLDVAGAQPVGAFTVRWDSPEPGQTTIGQVAWASSCGGTEAQVWRAVRVLAGVRWPFVNRRHGADRRRSQERRAA